MTTQEEAACRFMEETLLGSSCKNSSRAQMHYRVSHSLRVASLAREVARAENLHEETLVIGCLLHDIAYAELTPADNWRDHGRMGARMARPFVENLKLAPEDKANVLAGIALHVDMQADFLCEKTVTARSVCDCDNIDRFDVFRQPLVLREANFDEMTTDERIAFCDEKLAHAKKARDFPLATATALMLWNDRLDFQAAYFTRLRAQLEREREWTEERKC